MSLFFICLSVAHSKPSDNITELFRNADTVRSSDPIAFNQYLLEIKQNSQLLTEDQQEQLRFYESYAKAYSGDYEGAVKDLQSIIHISSNNLIKFRARTSLVNIFTSQEITKSPSLMYRR